MSMENALSYNIAITSSDDDIIVSDEISHDESEGGLSLPINSDSVEMS